MKRFKILLLIFISLIFIGGCDGCNSACGAETRYKCFAELYPEMAKEMKIYGLGEIRIETINGETLKQKVVGEAKHTISNQWYQLLNLDEPFEDVCDVVLIFFISDDNQLYWKHFSCATGYELIVDHCKTHNLDIREFVHLSKNMTKDNI